MRLLDVLLALSLVLALPLAVRAQEFRSEKGSKPPQGFVTRDEQPQKSEPVELSTEDLVRYDRAFGAVVVALENEDVEAFEGLMTTRLVDKHRKAQDPLSGLVDFMATVMAKRGGFAKFHELGRTARTIPGCEFPMLPGVFHLEDGTSGYIGIALDEESRIDEFSLIVKEDLCPRGSACEVPAHHFANAVEE